MNDLTSSEVLRQTMEAQRVAAVMRSYGVACDEARRDAIADLMHPDATAVYDVDADLSGGGAIADWVIAATAHLMWQQHSMTVMTVEVNGHRASAVSYLTSHQVSRDTPDVSMMMNSRYDTEFELVDGAWLIRGLHLTVGTIEHRPAMIGSLVAAGATTRDEHV